MTEETVRDFVPMVCPAFDKLLYRTFAEGFRGRHFPRQNG
jgi:hypothetical protein